MGDKTYHYSRCRDISMKQSTGELRYEGIGTRFPVAQFIGPKPLSLTCDGFTIGIVKRGRKGWIGMGLCHNRYPLERQPGWNTNSIGYHADNGGIYHGYGHSKLKVSRPGKRDVMGCSLDFHDNTVTFTLNGTEVYTSEPLQIPPGGFYPIVGLHSPGEVVRLLEEQPWTPFTERELSASHDVPYNFLYARETRVSQHTGIVRYQNNSRDPSVGQFVSRCPLSSACIRFSIEIASLGGESGVSIGVCHRCYPSNCQPGWLTQSLAYHADGRIFNGKSKAVMHVRAMKAGDTLACEINPISRTVTFRRNGTEVYKSDPLKIPQGGFHAILGLQSEGEAVCLLEQPPWRNTPTQVKSKSEESLLHTDCETDMSGRQVSNSSTEDSSEMNSLLSESANIPRVAESGSSNLECVQICDKTNNTGEEEDDVRASSDKAVCDMAEGEDVECRMPKCCICMDKGVSRFLIPCGHTFCVDCTEEWTLHHRTCPACRVRYQQINILYF